MPQEQSQAGSGQPSVRLFSPDVGEPLRTSGGLSPAMSLSAFWEVHFKPVYLASRGVTPATLAEYQHSIDYWVRFTGDPPLSEIGERETLLFVEGLQQLRGLRFGSKLGRNTVVKHCRHIQPILDLCGPRGKNNRRGQSLLADVPYIDRPRGYAKPPEDAYTPEEAQQIIRACETATVPALDGVAAPTWWRGIFLLGAYTGLRIGTLLALEFDWIQGEWLAVPAAGYKRAEPKRFYLNTHARAVLDSLSRPPRRRVFVWPHNKTTLFKWCGRIVAAAGLPKHRQFRFHGFRKLFATTTAELNPLVAQMALGHASLRTTEKHYLASRLQARTLEQLPEIRPLEDDCQRRLF